MPLFPMVFPTIVAFWIGMSSIVLHVLDTISILEMYIKLLDASSSRHDYLVCIIKPVIRKVLHAISLQKKR